MLLETRGCLEYDELDLPADLPGLGLGYHAHLPLDLPWKDGPAAVGDVIFALEQKIAFLRPRGYVLHPPEPGDLSGLLRHRPGLASKLWLENTREGDLCELWDEIGALGLGVCLDVGHMVSYGQERVMDLPGFFRARAHSPHLRRRIGARACGPWAVARSEPVARHPVASEGG